jgi:alpha-beta hydrolase superfamily lysophospholipase
MVDPTRATVADGHQISPYRTLTTEVWMPEVTGRRPLVVFAAGFRVGPAPYTTLLEGWARHGYIVAAPEFPLTDASVAGPNLDEGDLSNEPGDVRFVTDTLVSQMPSRIDPDRVAVAGHSDGAEVALALGAEAGPPGEPVYRAVIAMSPQPLPGPGRNPPLLVVQGTADTINPFARGYSTWMQAEAPKYLDVLHGAGHLTPLEAGSPWLGGLSRVTDAFLDAYVAGDAPSGAVSRAISGDG